MDFDPTKPAARPMPADRAMAPARGGEALRPAPADTALAASARALALTPGDVVLVRVLAPAARPGAGPSAAPNGDRARTAYADTGVRVPPDARGSGQRAPIFMEVEIRGQRLVARTPPGLSPGAEFQARVAGGRELPTLIPTGAREPSRDPVADVRYLDVRASARPHRESVRQLVLANARLERLLEPDGRRPPEPGAQRLAGAVRSLVSALPTPATLTSPSGLAAAVTHRGTTLEATVARTVEAAAARHPDSTSGPARTAFEDEALRALKALGDRDLKALVLKIRDEASRLTPDGRHPTPRPTSPDAPPPAPARSETLARLADDIGRTANAMLSQLEVQQLAPVVGDDTAARFIDIPLAPDERLRALELTVEEREGREPEGRSPERTVRLRLDLGQLGPVTVTLGHRPAPDAGDTGAGDLAVRFVARKAAVADALGAALPTLKSRLEQAGFEVRRLVAEPGAVTDTLTPDATRRPLIDVET